MTHLPLILTRIGIGVLLVLMMSGCNLALGGSSVPIGTPTTAPADDKPLAEISSPAPGARVLNNTPLTVTVRALDGAGVTRVQLFADGVLVASRTPPTGNETLFSTTIDYTPTGLGEVQLQALAFRGTVSSDPAVVTITVIQQNIPTQSGGGVIQPPVVITQQPPFDPTCRVRVNTSLNLRTGPGTVYDRILTLGPNTTALVIGRTFDNTWFQIAVGGFTGWVSNSPGLITVQGICTTVPVPPIPPPPTRQVTAVPSATPTLPPQITPSPTATPGPADLVVVTFDGPSTLTLDPVTGQVVGDFSVTITNTGARDTGQFSNIVVIEPPNVTPSTIALSTVGGLRPGETILLTFSVTFSTPANYTLTARADSDNQVQELSEVNNNALKSVSVTAAP